MIKKLIEKYKAYRKRKLQTKAYKEITTALASNPTILAEKKLQFEKTFGIDSKTRTREQWANLVRVYGIATVAEKEGLTEREVNLKCTESFSIRLKREFKEKAANA